MTQIAQAPAVAQIESDLQCIRCDYNLRGLEAVGRCPECGLEIARTLAAITVGQSTWLRRMQRGLDWFFLAAAFGCGGVYWAWDVARLWRSGLFALALMVCAWVITRRSRDHTGRERCSRAGRIARGAAVGMVLIFLWSGWRRYDPSGTESLVLIAAGVCEVACFVHLSAVARRIGMGTVGATMRMVPWFLAAGMLPKLFQVLIGSRIRLSLPRELSFGLQYGGETVHMAGWVLGLLLVGRMAERIREIRGTPVSGAAGPGLPWAVALLGAFAPFWWLLAHPLVWSWYVAFIASAAVYVAGLWLISLGDRSRVAIMTRAAAALLALTVVIQIWAGLTKRFYGAAWGIGLFTGTLVGMLGAVVCSHILVRRMAAQWGKLDLARAVGLRMVLMCSAIVVPVGIVWALMLSGGARWEIFNTVQLAGWLVLMETVVILGRVWQAATGTPPVSD